MTNPVLVPSYHPPTMVGGELTTGLSNLCAPVFECTTVLLYAFCDEHSLIRIVYCSTIGNLHICVQRNQYCYFYKFISFYLQYDSTRYHKSVDKCGACCSCCCSFLFEWKMQDWQTLCCGIRKCRRDTKNTESTICVAKMLLSVSVSELLLLFFLARWFWIKLCRSLCFRNGNQSWQTGIATIG